MVGMQSLADSLAEVDSDGDAAAPEDEAEEDGLLEFSFSPSRPPPCDAVDLNCGVDGVEALVAALRGGVADEDTQQRFRKSLDALCQVCPLGTGSERNKQHAVRVGVFGVLVAIMETHADCTEVHVDGCRLIALLCHGSSERQAHAAQAGIVAAVLRLMPRHTASEALSAACAHALSNAVHCKDTRAAAAQAGIPLLLAGMRTHLHSVAVQAMTWDALANLTLDDDNGAVQAGAVEACVVALAAHPDMVPILNQAVWALRNMAMHSHNLTNAQRASALKAVVAAMQRHPQEEGIARLGCGVIMFITYRAMDDTTAGSCGCIQAVVAAMRTHTGCTELQTHACSALDVMTRVVAGNVPIACTAGAVPALIGTMRSLLSDADVVSGACAALRNMAMQPCGKECVHHAGGFAAIAAVLRAHMQNATVLIAACHALANSVHTHVAACQPAADAGCLVLLLAVLRKNSDNAEVQTSCLRALTGMLQLGPLNGTAVNFGALNDVMAAMQRHAANANLQQLCCVVVGNMAEDTAAARDAVLARGNDIVEILVGMRHTRNWDAVESAMVLLMLLVRLRPELRAAAVDAGGIEALLGVECVHASHRAERGPGRTCESVSVLIMGDAAAQRRAIACGAFKLVKHFVATDAAVPGTMRYLARTLRAAVDAHTAGGCASAVDCELCVASRAVCGHAGCDARAALKKCGACCAAAYCSREHQRGAWEAHKRLCAVRVCVARACSSAEEEEAE
jgi:hypothetical protein